MIGRAQLVAPRGFWEQTRVDSIGHVRAFKEGWRWRGRCNCRRRWRTVAVDSFRIQLVAPDWIVSREARFWYDCATVMEEELGLVEVQCVLVVESRERLACGQHVASVRSGLERRSVGAQEHLERRAERDGFDGTQVVAPVAKRRWRRGRRWGRRRRCGWWWGRRWSAAATAARSAVAARAVAKAGVDKEDTRRVLGMPSGDPGCPPQAEDEHAGRERKGKLFELDTLIHRMPTAPRCRPTQD